MVRPFSSIQLFSAHRQGQDLLTYFPKNTSFDIRSFQFMTTPKLISSLAAVVAFSLFFSACQAGAPVTPPSQQGASNTQQTAPVVGTKISISGNAFSPSNLSVKVGQTVTWTNSDGYAHTVVSDDGTINSGNLDTGKTFSSSFSKTGTYAYHCSIHPYMTGTITVTQ